MLTVIDVGGHIMYSNLWPSVAKSAEALILVYDVADRRTFDSMWGFYRTIAEAKGCKPAAIPTILVGNMVDTVGKRPRQVTHEMGKSFASLLNVPFFETSARAPKSVSMCFQALIEEAQRKTHAHLGFAPTQLPDNKHMSHNALSCRMSNQDIFSSGRFERPPLGIRRGSEDVLKARDSSDSRPTMDSSISGSDDTNQSFISIGRDLTQTSSIHSNPSLPRMDFLPGTITSNPTMWRYGSLRRPSEVSSATVGTLCSQWSAASSHNNEDFEEISPSSEIFTRRSSSSSAHAHQPSTHSPESQSIFTFNQFGSMSSMLHTVKVGNAPEARPGGIRQRRDAIYSALLERAEDPDGEQHLEMKPLPNLPTSGEMLTDGEHLSAMRSFSRLPTVHEGNNGSVTSMMRMASVSPHSNYVYNTTMSPLPQMGNMTYVPYLYAQTPSGAFSGIHVSGVPTGRPTARKSSLPDISSPNRDPRYSADSSRTIRAAASMPYRIDTTTGGAGLMKCRPSPCPSSFSAASSKKSQVFDDALRELDELMHDISVKTGSAEQSRQPQITYEPPPPADGDVAAAAEVSGNMKEGSSTPQRGGEGLKIQTSLDIVGGSGKKIYIPPRKGSLGMSPSSAMSPSSILTRKATQSSPLSASVEYYDRPSSNLHVEFSPAASPTTPSRNVSVTSFQSNRSASSRISNADSVIRIKPPSLHPSTHSRPSKPPALTRSRVGSNASSSTALSHPHSETSTATSSGSLLNYLTHSGGISQVSGPKSAEPRSPSTLSNLKGAKVTDEDMELETPEEHQQDLATAEPAGPLLHRRSLSGNEFGSLGRRSRLRTVSTGSLVLDSDSGVVKVVSSDSEVQVASVDSETEVLGMRLSTVGEEEPSSTGFEMLRQSDNARRSLEEDEVEDEGPMTPLTPEEESGNDKQKYFPSPATFLIAQSDPLSPMSTTFVSKPFDRHSVRDSMSSSASSPRRRENGNEVEGGAVMMEKETKRDEGKEKMYGSGEGPSF
ncbi:Ras GTPase [Chytridiales sp. JEL 0842]|nr:Ras GTPase [Chytridiales sp. JEL 0842]